MSCIDQRTGYTLVACWQQWCCCASVSNTSVDAMVVGQLACWLTQQCCFARVHDLLVVLGDALTDVLLGSDSL